MAYVYTVVGHCGDMARTYDLEHAGQIVHALMMTRADNGSDAPYEDFWVRDSSGNEYYWSKDCRTVFSAACGDGDK